MLDAVAAQAWRLIDAMSDPGPALALVSGGLAALLVIVSAFVKTMIPLRWLAVGSNVGFILYGLLFPNPLMLALHGVLLPVNLVRVRQMMRLTRRVRAYADREQMDVWLRPYMRSSRYRTGDTIFARGDPAERLYLLAEGRVELPDVGRTLQAGEMFGEIAFFTPDGRRSSAAVCRTPCTVLSIDEHTFRQLVHQNPDFGVEVVRLIATRLTGDVQRLRAAAESPP